MASQAELTRFREIISSRPDEERARFVEKYKSLDADKKEQLLQKTIQAFPTEKKETVGDGLTEIMCSSKKIDSGDPIIDAGLHLQKEVVAPITQATNTALFGLPKYLLNKFDPQMADEVFAEQSTTLGKTRRVAGDLLGLFQGGAAKLATEAGKRIVPKAAPLALQALKNPKNATNVIKGINRGNIARGAVEGAVFGGTQIVGDDTSIEQQLAGAATGGILGAGASSLFGRTISETGKKSSKWFRGARKRDARGSKRSALVRMNERLSGAKAKASKKGKELTATAKQKRAISSEEMRKFSQEADAELTSTLQGLKQNQQQIKAEILEQAKSGKLKVEKTLGDFSRANSIAYGQQLDDIAESIALSGEQINIATVDDMLKSSFDEIESMGISSGKVNKVLNNLKRKYGRKIIGGSGGRSSKSLRPNDDDLVNVKKLVKDFKGIGKELSPGVKNRTGKMTPEDMSLMIIKRNFGKMIDDVSSGSFTELQQTYSKSVEITKDAYKTFQPRRGDTGGERGLNILKSIGEGKIASGTPKDNFIKFLEEGGTIGKQKVKGLGDLTSDLRKSALNLQKIDDQIVKAKASKKVKLREKSDSLKQQLSRDLKDIEGKQDSLSKNLQLELDRLTQRKQLVQDLSARLQHEKSKPLAKIIKNLPERAVEATAIGLMFKILGAFDD